MKKQSSWFWSIMIVIMAIGYYFWAKDIDNRKYDDVARQKSLFISQEERTDKTDSVPEWEDDIYEDSSSYGRYVEDDTEAEIPRPSIIIDCSSHVGTFRY